MTDPATHRRLASTRAFRLRVEPLDERCVLSASPLGTDLLLTRPDLPSAPALSMPPVVAYGPLMTVPSEMAAGRDATVDWGDGLVTPAILLAGDENGTIEVWAERVAEPTATYRLTITFANARLPSVDTFVVEVDYSAQLVAGTENDPDPPVVAFDPDTIAPTIKTDGTLEQPGAACVQPPLDPQPTAAPLSPAAHAFALPPPRSESPFRAGEVQLLATVTALPRVTPSPAVDWLPTRQQQTLLRTNNTNAFGPAPGQVTAAEVRPQGVATPSAGHALASSLQPLGIGGTRVVEHREPGHAVNAGSNLAIDPARTTQAVTTSRILSLIAGRELQVDVSPETHGYGTDAGTGPGRALVVTYAAETVSDAVFAAAPDAIGSHDSMWPRPCGWVKRSLAMLATAIAGYRFWVPRFGPHDDLQPGTGRCVPPE